MCSPAALPILTGIGAITSFIGQSAAAKAQDKQIQAGYALQSEAFAAQRQEIQDTAETEISDRVRQAQIERGQLRVAQGESGLTGASHNRLERDVQFQAGADISRIQKNAENRTKASKREQAGARHRAKTNALQIRRPSIIGTGLQIAGAGVDYHNAKKQG